MDGILGACNEVCWKKRGRRSKGEAWWWNDEVKEAISRKKYAYKAMCRNSTEGNRNRYEDMMKKALMAVSKAMREKAEGALTEFQNGMFRFVGGLMTDGEEVEGIRCVRGGDGKLFLSGKEGGKVWKDYVEGGAVEGQVVNIEEVVHVVNEIKTGKALGPSDISLELIAASREEGIQLTAEIYQRVLDVFEMPVEWALCIVVPIFKGKGDIRNCSCH